MLDVELDESTTRIFLLSELDENIQGLGCDFSQNILILSGYARENIFPERYRLYS